MIRWLGAGAIWRYSNKQSHSPRSVLADGWPHLYIVSIRVLSFDKLRSRFQHEHAIESLEAVPYKTYSGPAVIVTQPTQSQEHKA